MDPKQFQYLASGLAEHGTSESEFRTAISRAYYAVFNLGVILLNELGFTIPKNQYAHEEVRRHFNNSGDNDLIELAIKIDDLRTKRNHADYDLDRHDVEEKQNAKKYVYLADRLIKILEERCTGNNCNQIIKSIEDWKKKLSSETPTS
jgi:uncharacterized protein (UPF0332 family)